MAVIVEPQLSAPVILIRGMGRVAEVLATPGATLKYQGCGASFCMKAPRYASAEQIITKPLDLDELDFSVDYFILGTHHRDDDQLSLKALEMGVPDVAVIASEKKAGIIIDYLKKQGASDEALERFHAPAGLDLHATAAEEIALSIMSEIVMHHNGGTGNTIQQVSPRT